MKYIYTNLRPRGYYMYVYLYPDNISPFYVGKGKGKRFLHHLSETKNNTENYKKWAVIEGLRRKNKTPIIIILESNLSEDIAYGIETKIIKLLGRKDIDANGILTNILLDSKPPHNPWSDERREKARIRAKNQIITDDMRGKCRAANLGRKVSPESKKKMSIAAKDRIEKYGNTMLGKKHKPETIEKLKAKAKNRTIVKKQCHWCQRHFDPGNYAQFHGDKCKIKPYSCKL